MQFIIRKLDQGMDFNVDISDCDNMGDLHEKLKTEYGFGDSDFEVISGASDDADFFAKGRFLDQRVFEFQDLDEHSQKVVLAWIEEVGGDESVEKILQLLLSYDNDRDGMLDTLMSFFSIPEEIERFIDKDAVYREGQIIYQIVRFRDEYFIFNRN